MAQQELATRETATPGALPADVRRAALNGAVWIVAGTLALQATRFAFNVLLTRLLAPQIFGLMALVSLFLQGLQMFSDLGIRQVVVANPHGEEADFLDTAWTLQAARGLLLALAATLLAGPLAALYGQPDLRWLIPLTGATAALTGFDATAPLVLARRLVRGPLVLLELGTYLVSLSVVLAVLGAGAVLGHEGVSTEVYRLRALAAGPLAGALFELVVSHRMAPRRRHRLLWSPEPGRAILNFGGWVFLSSACTFLAAQADRLVVGKVSLEMLGVYHIAAMLAAVPSLLLFTLSSQLVFPLCARLLRSGEHGRSALTRVYWIAAAVAGLTATGLIGAGPALVDCLYDVRYRGAGPLLQLLAVGAWLTMLMATRERVLEARGRTLCLAVAQGVKLVVLAGALPLGLHWAGLPGAALGVATAEAARYIVIVLFARGEGLPGPAGDFGLSCLVAAAAGAALAAAALPGPATSAWLRLALAVPAALLPWLLAVGLLWFSGRVALPGLWRGRVVRAEGALEGCP